MSHPSACPRPPSAPRARSTAIALLAVLALLFGGPLPATAQESLPPWEPDVESLGTAMNVPSLGNTTFATLPDGTPVAYSFNDGNPVTLNVIDLATGEVLDRQVFDGGPTTGSSLAVDPADGMVYLSVRPADGSLYRYDPAARTVELLETAVVGETFLRTMLIRDGILYGSTYPNAKAYSYDLDTGEIRDYGSVAEDVAYAWGFDEVGGNLWVGTGATAFLREVDVTTGDITDIPLPADVEENADFISRIVRHDDLVVLNFSPSFDGRNTMVHDLSAGEWIDSLGIIGQITRTSHDGAFYHLSGPEIYSYDIAAREQVRVPVTETGIVTAGTTALELVDLGLPDFPGPTLVGVQGDGTIWRYNLANGTGDTVVAPVVGSDVTIQSMGIGPDGNVYVGAYLAPDVMARVNHATGEVEQLDGPGQSDAIATVGDQLLIGTYTGAGMYAGTLDDPWDWGTNPAELFTIGRDNGYDRFSDLVAAGDQAAGALIGNYGEPGGALTVFDPLTGEYAIHDVVPGHSVVSVEYTDGLIIGGSSIHGAIDTVPGEGPAQLFVWDMEAEQVVSVTVPDENAEIIHTLAFDDQDRLWGMTDTGTLFEYDVEAGEIVRSTDTPLSNGNIWGRLSELQANPADGLMYGNAGGRMFRFDPDTMELQVHEGHSGVRYSTVTEDGTVYFGDQTALYRFAPDGDAGQPECATVITGAHPGRLVVTETDTCVREAEIRGPMIVEPGASVHIRNSAISGGLRSTDAAAITIVDSRVNGGVRIDGTTGTLAISGGQFNGGLLCEGNAEPVEFGKAPTVNGRTTGDCLSSAP